MGAAMRLVWAGLFLILGAPTVWANESLDLVKQQKDYGFQGVAMIVSAYETSDQPGHEIQTILRKAGLPQLTMPLSIGESLKAQVSHHSPVERCGWQWGVHCHSVLQWTTQAPKNWKTLCMRGDQVEESVEIRSILLTQPSASKGEIQFDGIQDCWANGGDGLRLESIKTAKP